MRDAAGSLALPLSIQDSLSQLIPGFSQAAAGGGGVALVAKLSVPVGVKALVAGLSVVAVGGTLAVGQSPQHDGRRATAAGAPVRVHVRPEPDAAPASVAPARVAARPVTHVVRTAFVAARTAAPKRGSDMAHPAAVTRRSNDEQEQEKQQPKETDSNDGESKSDHVGFALTAHSSDKSDSGDEHQQDEPSDDGGDAARGD
jgi:hypothetical protein